MAEKASEGTSLGEKKAASPKTTLGGGGSAKVRQASAKVGQASAKVGQASAKVGQASAKVGQASPKVGQASARVGQASAKVGQASAKVGQASPKVGQASAAVTLAERPEDVANLVSRVTKDGGSATVRLAGRTLASALAGLGDKVDAISAVVTLRGNAPAK